MNKLRAALIAAMTASAAAAACSDNTPSISAPSSGPNLTGGVWTSTIWQPTDSGLKYVGSRSGLYRSEVDGKALVDSGNTLQLDARAIDAGRQRIETETVLARMNQSDGTLAATRLGTGNSRYRPQFRNARSVVLGKQDGKTYSLQQSATNSAGEPPTSSILLVDGMPIAIRTSQFKQVNGRWRTLHSTTSMIDSAARTQFIVETDFGVDANTKSSSGLAAVDRLKSGIVTAGDALAGFVLPATLQAETLEDGSVPCHTELMDQLKATGAWAAAAAALAAAIGTCPFTAATCFTIPFLQIALVAADVALGVATGIYAACMINNNRAQAAGNAGAGGGGDRLCVTVDWYLSTDGGRTWKYVDSTYQCDSTAVNPI